MVENSVEEKMESTGRYYGQKKKKNTFVILGQYTLFLSLRFVFYINLCLKVIPKFYLKVSRQTTLLCYLLVGLNTKYGKKHFPPIQDLMPQRFPCHCCSSSRNGTARLRRWLCRGFISTWGTHLYNTQGKGLKKKREILAQVKKHDLFWVHVRYLVGTPDVPWGQRILQRICFKLWRKKNSK